MATNTAAELQYNDWNACLVPASVWYAPLISTCPQSQIEKIPHVTSQHQGDASLVDQTEPDPLSSSTGHLRVSQMDSIDNQSSFQFSLKGQGGSWNDVIWMPAKFYTFWRSRVPDTRSMPHLSFASNVCNWTASENTSQNLVDMTAWILFSVPWGGNLSLVCFNGKYKK